MKTSLTTKTLSALLIMANISIACGNNNPVIYNAGSERNKLYSFNLANVDGDSVKAEKSQVAENKTNTFTINAPVAIGKDFSCLRFDVNKFVDGSESVITELPVSDFDYLRFDVNKYTNGSESEITELPVSDFDYLRFDMNAFIEHNPVDIEEMPFNEYDYLRLELNQVMKSDIANDRSIGELPMAE